MKYYKYIKLFSETTSKSARTIQSQAAWNDVKFAAAKTEGHQSQLCAETYQLLW